MSSIWQCEQEIQRYRNLSSNLKTIISSLSSAAGNTYSLSNEIDNKYQVNDSFTPIVTKTNQLKNDIESTCNYLKITVIPAIDAEINELEREIDRIEQEERERREREEQERREREEREAEEERQRQAAAVAAAQAKKSKINKRW